MVRKIIACGDLHIRNVRRMEEYKEQLGKFVEICKQEVSKLDNSDELRIVVTGDVFHNKLDISSEAYIMANWFFNELDQISRTYVIAGNHDLNMKNLQRKSPIDTLCGLSNYKQVVFIDKELDYKSGCVEDDNIVWCLYSSFDKFSRPKIEYYEGGDKALIGLIHADIKGSRTDVGYSGENGIATSYFDGLDLCLCGHIHKRQKLTYGSTDIVYTGSLIQQDHGENISGHGYIIYDVEEEEYEEVDIENDNYGYYTFQINSEDDIKENKEEILNF